MGSKIVAWMIAQGNVRVPVSAFDARYKTSLAAREGLARLIASGHIVRWDDCGVETLSLTDLTAGKYRLTMHVDVKPDGSEIERWITPDKKIPRTKLAIEMKRKEPVTLEADFRSPERVNGMDSFVNHADQDPAQIVEDYEEHEEEIVREKAEPKPPPVEIRIDPVEVIKSARTRKEAERLNELLQVFGRRHHACDAPVRERFSHPTISLTGVRPWPVDGQSQCTSQGPLFPLLPHGGVSKLPKKGTIPIDGDYIYKGNCPVCKGLPLPPTVECLNCGRSGVDHKLEKVYPERVIKPTIAVDGLVGGVGNKPKETRKEKRARNKNQRSAS